MSRIVVLVDVSNSMRCKLENMKKWLKEYWLPYIMGSPPTNEVALISFSNDVCVQSHYTTDLSCLQALVDGLVVSGCDGPMTSLYDAIIVGLVFESPIPDELYVWSDLGDTNSDASETDWQDLANSLGITVNLCPPYEWLQDPNCVHYAVIAIPKIKLIPYAKSLDIATKFSKKVEKLNIIKTPEDIVKLKKR